MVNTRGAARWGRRLTGALAVGALSAGAQTAPHPADAAFMAGMIAHHAQALVMVDLIAGRTSAPVVATLGERIAVSQRDEIALMQGWLRDRGAPAPEPATRYTRGGGDAHAAHASHGDTHAPGAMPGMLTQAQLDELASARGQAFDRLFLSRMIAHHEGALVMVAALLKTPGAAQEPEIFRFASDVDADQRAEIRRMRALLDARAGHTDGSSAGRGAGASRASRRRAAP
jgi:uncharacterized protein (DUF305 family)